MNETGKLYELQTNQTLPGENNMNSIHTKKGQKLKLLPLKIVSVETLKEYLLSLGIFSYQHELALNSRAGAVFQT